MLPPFDDFSTHTMRGMAIDDGKTNWTNYDRADHQSGLRYYQGNMIPSNLIFFGTKVAYINAKGEPYFHAVVAIVGGRSSHKKIVCTVKPSGFRSCFLKYAQKNFLVVL